MTVKDVYSFIDQLAPFRLQEDYDNSGLCVGSMDRSVTRILTALDCTIDVAREAADKGCELIVTHHPVIFRGIKKLDLDSVVGVLAAKGISVICAHTSFDTAVLNDILCEKLGLTPKGCIVGEGLEGMGCICESEGFSPQELAEHIKAALGNEVVRYNRLNSTAEERPLKRIAVCSGSGGSFLGDVISKGCDAFITGDVKHDVFIDAFNAGVTVYDAGHFHTENIFAKYMSSRLKEAFPEADTNVAFTNKDVLNYK